MVGLSPLLAVALGFIRISPPPTKKKKKKTACHQQRTQVDESYVRMSCCLSLSTVFAIYQILLGWETYKYYSETVGLHNPRPNPTQQKSRLKVAIGPFFPAVNTFFVG